MSVRFFFSSRRRHTRSKRDWSSDVCSSDLFMSARAQLHDIQTGKRPVEIDVTKAQLAQATANARKAALQLTRDEAQHSAGGIPKAQLDDSRANAESTAAQVRELSYQIDVARLP